MEEIKSIGNRNYKIVEKVPTDYVVWNIGEHMGSDEYIPFCQVIPGTLHIVADTLLAVKLPKEEVKILRKVAQWDDTDIITMNRRINWHAKYDCDKETLIKAKEILERIYG